MLKQQKMEKSEKVILPGAGLILKGGKKEPYYISSYAFSHMKYSEVDLISQIR